MAGKIKDIDHGWIDIKRRLKKADGSFTKVGVQQGTIHRGSTKGLSDLVQIAAINEFGSKNQSKKGAIPSRPALRQAFDMHQAEIKEVTARLYGGVLDRKISAKTGLGLLGEFVASKMKRQITLLREPSNAPSTIKRKRSSNPLIDTGQYRASITHVEIMK